MSLRPALYGALYLLIAVGFDRGVLEAVGGGWEHFRPGELRLTALGVALVGLLRKPGEAFAFALVAAIVWGATAGPGQVGATIVSFSLLAWGASALGKLFYLEPTWFRLPLLFGMLTIEARAWSMTRELLWRETVPETQWIEHAAAALIGVLLYKASLGGGLRTRGAPPWPIGRKRPGE